MDGMGSWEQCEIYNKNILTQVSHFCHGLKKICSGFEVIQVEYFGWIQTSIMITTLSSIKISVNFCANKVRTRYAVFTKW